MSQANIKLVRRIYQEGLMDRDQERLVNEFATPSIEHVNPPETVEPGVRRGRDEVAQAMRQSSDSFDSSRHELHELFDCGDTVVAAVSFRARSRARKSAQRNSTPAARTAPRRSPACLIAAGSRSTPTRYGAGRPARSASSAAPTSSSPSPQAGSSFAEGRARGFSARRGGRRRPGRRGR
jgi:ketosteroid isomerase-like protein